jgi:hypothetical protein
MLGNGFQLAVVRLWSRLKLIRAYFPRFFHFLLYKIPHPFNFVFKKKTSQNHS